MHISDLPGSTRTVTDMRNKRIYLPQPEAVHNTAWWPDVKDTYEAFVTAHPRQPYPDRLTWESDLREDTGRAHWLVIDRLGAAPSDRPLEDVNRFQPPNGGPEQPMFARTKPSGRVDVVRRGNHFEATTRGVAR